MTKRAFLQGCGVRPTIKYECRGGAVVCLSQTRKGHIYMLIKCIAAKRINKLPSKLGHSRRKTEHINHIFGKLHLQVFHLKKCGRHGAEQTSAYGIKTPRVRYITALEVLLYFTPIGLRNTAFSCTPVLCVFCPSSVSVVVMEIGYTTQLSVKLSKWHTFFPSVFPIFDTTNSVSWKYCGKIILVLSLSRLKENIISRFLWQQVTASS